MTWYFSLGLYAGVWEPNTWSCYCVCTAHESSTEFGHAANGLPSRFVMVNPKHKYWGSLQVTYEKCFSCYYIVEGSSIKMHFQSTVWLFIRNVVVLLKSTLCRLLIFTCFWVLLGKVEHLQYFFNGQNRVLLNLLEMLDCFG